MKDQTSRQKLSTPGTARYDNWDACVGRASPVVSGGARRTLGHASARGKTFACHFDPSAAPALASSGGEDPSCSRSAGYS